MSGLISQGGTSVQIADKLKAFDSLDTLGSSRHLESSGEGKSRKKTSPAAGIFLLSQPTSLSRICSDLPRRVLGCWAQRRRNFGFLYQRFSSLYLRRSLSVPKPAKQNVGHSGDHGSIWDSWPIAFSGYPRGPRVGCETGCPRHTAPN